MSKLLDLVNRLYAADVANRAGITVEYAYDLLFTREWPNKTGHEEWLLDADPSAVADWVRSIAKHEEGAVRQ
jgi:hypothetical protein